MNKLLVEIVVETLNAAGIPAQRAFSAEKMPAIGSLATAVGLKKMDPVAGTATVKVSVLSPGTMGAPVCEDAGLQICRLLANIGGNCRQGEVTYDARGDVFCVPVEAEFEGYETSAGWNDLAPDATFIVKVGNSVLNHAVSFDAEYSIVVTEQQNVESRWTFCLEEIIPLDMQETAMPNEPFSITVVREYGTDTYSGCVITGQKRLFREDGLHHIWEGKATGMTLVI